MTFYKLTILMVCLLLQIVGVAIFMKGFFPVKSAISGHATFNDYEAEPTNINQTETADYTFNRLIIVLIDALRADFVFSEEAKERMPHLSYLLSSSNALGFRAKSHPPTVTLPRIKAITTGSIPGFIDVVLNFDSQALMEDNIIKQFHLSGKRVVFYGDDTWIKLFPELFIRSDGTTSFFVTDYTEVDNNVTRHISSEMSQQDWDVLILHYLGLDHIGHLAGPSSPLVKPKLLEMDSIIEEIYKNLIQRDREQGTRSLLVVCGDHGMSDQGSHGGSSVPEVMTPLVLIDTQSKLSQVSQSTYSEVEQVDIAATVSVLMGVPIPKNSLGITISASLSWTSMRQQLKIAYQNSQQILSVFKNYAQYSESDDAVVTLNRAIKSHIDWLTLYQNKPTHLSLNGQGEKILRLYRKCKLGMRGQVLSQLSQYDLHAMVAGSIILWIVLLSLLCGSVMKKSASHILTLRHVSVTVSVFIVISMLHMVACTSSHHSKALCSVSFTSVIIFTLVVSGLSFLVPVSLNVSLYAELYKQMLSMSALSCGMIFGTVLHTLSLFSSSFVEEEHQTWYFFTITINLLLLSFMVLPSIFHFKQKCSPENCDTNIGKTTPFSATKNHIHNEQSDLFDTGSDGNYIQIKQNKDDSGVRTVTMPDLRSVDSHRVIICFCIVLIISRVLRIWNQTGDKWAHLPDVGDWLVRPENKAVLSTLAIISIICLCTLRWSNHPKGCHLIFCLACAGIFYFRVVSGALCIPGLGSSRISNGVGEARFVFLLILILAVNTVRLMSKSWRSSDELGQGLSCLLSVWVLLILLLMRPHNIVYIVMVTILEACTSYIMEQQKMSCLTMTLIHLWMGQASYFYQGNSNSISSVDVSAGYVGLEEYNAPLIAVLMVCSTYAGPIFWLISLLKNLAYRCKTTEENTNRWFPENLVRVGYTLAVTRALPLSAYTVLCTFQRFHLFVWTVFSPKLLFEAMFTVVITLLLSLIFVVSLFFRYVKS